MKIICIGRNYAAHAGELKNEIPDKPVFFLKPDTALLPNGRPFYIPDFSSDIHYEVELVYKISKEGKNIEESFAHRYYDQLGLGIDFTARDVQDYQKSKGLPWEPAKAFDNSAPVGIFINKADMTAEKGIEFSLTKNGETVQIGNSEMMLHSIDKIISYVSGFITLKKGDLIFTGTPAGVGKVSKGDRLEAFLQGKLNLKVEIL
ncbi:MAG: FAA hydrolase family protein [Bacteroidetes bacterium]|nr:MAG: FAA hydrolase family protein [Bacteroidota bacterium]REJ99913.1 MAG: FAA hydrolase family protein [Bacteroidota bacterium]REK35907.1 MAG: FAA hydrolase family protein [Bacteroidota bacterium]REK50616.1 MAG: FAA hydrolase family protein [Bacteroidota bacterium]